MILAPLIPAQSSLVADYDITTMVDNERVVAALIECAYKKNKIHNMNSYIDEQFQRITERVPKHYFYE